VTKTEIDSSSATASFLARLAIVYEDPLRLKIVAELYMREMSPKLFFEEFGGGSVPRVARHFDRLVEYGWLKLERTETGGRRRGAVEHFYRAPELAFLDQEAWAKLPFPMRSAFSRSVFELLTERVETALSAGTFNARAERHLTWTPVLLDELGWERVVAAFRAVFGAIVEEQKHSKLRTEKSGERPHLITVALSAFESPLTISREDAVPDALRVGDDPVDCDKRQEPTPFFPVQLAKILADPEALQILAQLNVREMSPKQFHDEFGGASLASIGRRFKKLAKGGWLTLVREERGGKRRGATEHFYRAIGPAILDTEDWSELPDSLKATLTWKTFEQLRERVQQAMAAGTFDARIDRHLSWTPLLLDQPGWEAVLAAVNTLFHTVLVEARSAEQRMAKTGEEPLEATIALAAFESPKQSERAP
jgi:DNA-binding transcriptional ArsR family regulator